MILKDLKHGDMFRFKDTGSEEDCEEDTWLRCKGSTSTDEDQRERIVNLSQTMCLPAPFAYNYPVIRIGEFKMYKYGGMYIKAIK